MVASHRAYVREHVKKFFLLSVIQYELLCTIANDSSRSLPGFIFIATQCEYPSQLVYKYCQYNLYCERHL